MKFLVRKTVSVGSSDTAKFGLSEKERRLSANTVYEVQDGSPLAKYIESIKDQKYEDYSGTLRKEISLVVIIETESSTPVVREPKKVKSEEKPVVEAKEDDSKESASEEKEEQEGKRSTRTRRT